MPTSAQHFVIGDSPLWFDLDMPDVAMGVARTCLAGDPKSMRRTKGRQLAKLAQERLGLPQHDIGRGDDGAPVWPLGQGGSFSHWNDLSLCLLSRHTAQDYGADIEGLADDASIEAICSEAITLSERAYVGDRHPLKIDAALAFSAKESFFKAAYPRVGHVFGFEALQLVARPHKGVLQFELATHLAPELTPGRRVFVQYKILESAVVTWTAL